MKKILTLFIAIVLVISLTACGDGGAGSSEPVDAVADGQEQQSGGQDKTEGAGTQDQQGNIQPTTGVTDSDPNATVGQQSDLQGDTNKKSNIFVGTWKALEESDPSILTIKDDGTGTITYDNYDAVYNLTYTISKSEDGYTVMEYTNPISNTENISCLMIKDTFGHELMLDYYGFYCHPDEYEDVMYQMSTNFASQLTADVYQPYVKGDEYYAFVVIHNPTEYPLYTTASVNMYDSEHNLVDTKNFSNLYNVIAGNTDFLFKVSSSKPFESYECTIETAEYTFIKPLYTQLSYTSDPNHLIVENKGQYECDRMDITCLWLNGNEIVDYAEPFISSISPGESVTTAIRDTDQEYTERLFYIFSSMEADIGMYVVE